MLIGETLKLIREENNLSQRNVAELFNITASALSRYEKGDRTPNIDFLKRFALYFNISFDALTNNLTRDQIQDSIDDYKAGTLNKQTFDILDAYKLNNLPSSEIEKIKHYANYIYDSYIAELKTANKNTNKNNRDK